jgi:hypothetical protein
MATTIAGTIVTPQQVGAEFLLDVRRLALAPRLELEAPEPERVRAGDELRAHLLQALDAGGRHDVGQRRNRRLLREARYAEAEPLMAAAAKDLKPMPGLQDRERLANRARLVQLYEKLRRPQDAARYR